jgi:hypothetical protein
VSAIAAVRTFWNFIALRDMHMLVAFLTSEVTGLPGLLSRFRCYDKLLTGWTFLCPQSTRTPEVPSYWNHDGVATLGLYGTDAAGAKVMTLDPPVGSKTNKLLLMKAGMLALIVMLNAPV